MDGTMEPERIPQGSTKTTGTQRSQIKRLDFCLYLPFFTSSN